MPDILAKNLSGKAVMGSDGVDIGVLYNITIDAKSGAIGDLVVDPDEDTRDRNFDFGADEDGRYRVPVRRVQAVKDYIVVER